MAEHGRQFHRSVTVSGANEHIKAEVVVAMFRLVIDGCPLRHRGLAARFGQTHWCLGNGISLELIRKNSSLFFPSNTSYSRIWCPEKRLRANVRPSNHHLTRNRTVKLYRCTAKVTASASGFHHQPIAIYADATGKCYVV